MYGSSLEDKNMNFEELQQAILARPNITGVIDTGRNGENEIYNIKRIKIFTETNGVVTIGNYEILINKQSQEAFWNNNVPSFMIDQPEPQPEVIEEPVEEVIEE
jgi:hypothetical protein